MPGKGVLSFIFYRKADSESKGKVENVVEYVKKNFLQYRAYWYIGTLNAESPGLQEQPIAFHTTSPKRQDAKAGILY